MLCLVTGLVVIGGLSQAGMQIALQFDTGARGENYRHWFGRSDRGDVEFVTLGSSHSLAIDIDTLPGPANHLFLPLADIHEVRAVARAVLPDAENLKVVLFPVSPFLLYWDNAIQYPASRLANYGVVAMHSTVLIDGDIKGWFAARHQGLRAWSKIPGWVYCKTFTPSLCAKAPDFALGGIFPPNYADMKAKQFLDVIGPNYPVPLREADQIDAVRAFAEELSSRGVMLVFYPSPLSKALLEALAQRSDERGWGDNEGSVPDINAVRNAVLAATGSNSCVHWVDEIWSNTDAGTRAYYRRDDVDHLSPAGARVFTSRLVERLTQLGGCSK